MDDHGGLSCVLVSHTHWDREWYRPFEAFRARLVDTIDRVLDQLAADPGWSFLLDGQTVVLEDYLAIRAGRRAELEGCLPGGTPRNRSLVCPARLAPAVGRSPRPQPAGGATGRRDGGTGVHGRVHA